MKRFVCFSLAIASILIAGCHQNRELTSVWDYLSERPDSALAVLNKMDVSAFHGRTLAEYQLLKAMALDKNYIDVASDSLARPAAEYFQKHGPKRMKMLSYYYWGTAEYYADSLNHAILLLDQAEALAKECNDTRYIGYVYLSKGYVYRRAYNYKEAILSTEEGCKYVSLLPDSTLQVRRAKSLIALCLQGEQHYQEACDLFESLYAQWPTDTFLMRKVIPNMAWCHYTLDDPLPERAYALFQEAIENYHVVLDPTMAHHYACAALQAGKIEEAEQIRQILESMPSQQHFANDLRYRIAKFQKRYEEALGAFEEVLVEQNDLALRQMEQALVRTQRDFQQEARENAELKEARERERLIGYSIMFLLLLAGLLIWRHQEKARMNLEKEQLIANVRESETLRKLADDANTALEGQLEEAKAKYVAAFKKQFQRISSIVENYYTTSGNRNGRDQVYRQIMDLAATVGRDRASMKGLERSVNAALDNAFQLYKEEFPDQGHEHYNLVCYFMAGYTASMIELLTGFSTNTIYSKKNRLLEVIAESDAPHKDQFLVAIR